MEEIKKKYLGDSRMYDLKIGESSRGVKKRITSMFPHLKFNIKHHRKLGCFGLLIDPSPLEDDHNNKLEYYVTLINLLHFNRDRIYVKIKYVSGYFNRYKVKNFELAEVLTFELIKNIRSTVTNVFSLIRGLNSTYGEYKLDKRNPKILCILIAQRRMHKIRLLPLDLVRLIRDCLVGEKLPNFFEIPLYLCKKI